jgi:hypothetical protein
VSALPCAGPSSARRAPTRSSPRTPVFPLVIRGPVSGQPASGSGMAVRLATAWPGWWCHRAPKVPSERLPRSTRRRAGRKARRLLADQDGAGVPVGLPGSGSSWRADEDHRPDTQPRTRRRAVERRPARRPVPPVPCRHPRLRLADAYAIQSEVRALDVAHGAVRARLAELRWTGFGGGSRPEGLSRPGLPGRARLMAGTEVAPGRVVLLDRERAVVTVA